MCRIFIGSGALCLRWELMWALTASKNIMQAVFEGHDGSAHGSTSATRATASTDERMADLNELPRDILDHE